MRWLRLIILSLLVLPVVACDGGGDSDSSPASKIQKMLVREYAEYKAGIPGMEGGGLAMQITTSNATYFASTDFAVDVDRNTRFRGASTTKTFMSASVLLLHQQGLLDIDDKITDIAPGTGEAYVPDTAAYDVPFKSEITIRQLLGHRAGVFDVTNTDIPETVDQPYKGKNYVDWTKEQDFFHDFTFDELVGVVAENHLYYFSPGEDYHYSNTGYSILGTIVERISGLSWGEFVYRNLLIPNGLTETEFPDLGTEVALPAPFAPGHTYFDNVTFPSTEDNMSANVGEGNIISTLGNLSAWVRALISGQAGLSEETVALMMPDISAGKHYGLGCMYVPGLGYGHNGGHIGYLTNMSYDPAEDVSVVVFTSNANFMDLAGQLSLLYGVSREARRILGIPTEE